MNVPRTLLASAIVSALASLAHAESPPDAVLPKVIVTASPFGAGEGDQILSPAKILAGDELRDKLGSSLGETLSNELGVSASGFGAGASRPIIRGLEGARVKMLENGMAVSDVSGLSNDHAVSADGAISRQIEILRGPAALLYGSGAIGGLVNIVNERIPTALEPHVGGQTEMRYSTVDRASGISGSLDGAVGNVGMHLDGNLRHADDYRIPGGQQVGEAAPPDGRLPYSATRQDSIGAGAALIGDWGHFGASVSKLNNLYGIPTLEGARIDQSQRRYDVDGLWKLPLAGLEQLRFKMGYTDYQHAELDHQDQPEVRFSNRSLETRLEASHAPLGGWHGTFGVQTENTHFSALSAEGGPDTVPVTHSTSDALFLVEEHDFGAVRVNAGARAEHVKRDPLGHPARSFQLASYSAGAQWAFAPAYAAGATVSVAQRAPATEELYSGGPHDATSTFDIGNPNFRKETSRNLELSLQNTAGLLRWKANAFINKVSDFVYGNVSSDMVDEDGLPGGEFRVRRFQQGDATIHGAEGEVSWNQHGQGWSGRGFADMSRGRLDDAGSLPLQPAARFGADLAYRSAGLRAAVSAVRTLRQERLASSESTPTPAYTQLNASLSYTQHAGDVDLTWFLLAKNMLNEEIRLSTSLLKDVAPLPGRNFVIGVRTKF